MRTALILGILFIGVPAVALAASQQAEAEPVDVQAIGPQVGEVVPEFTLSDHRGASRSLSSLMGPRGLMLVFSRSASW